MVAEAEAGVNVVIWFAADLVATEGPAGPRPEVRFGGNLTCIAEVSSPLLSYLFCNCTTATVLAGPVLYWLLLLPLQTAQKLRQLQLPTTHLLSIGGWDAPHPNTTFYGVP